MKKILVGVFLVIVTASLILFFRAQSSPKSQEKRQEKKEEVESETKFSTPKKSAHYESNTPEHAAILAAVPLNVVVNFNFDLAKPSSISIKKDDRDYSVGETIIDENSLSMRRDMDPQAPDGIYTVEYKACWADGSCHDGSFEFAIDQKKLGEYEDMRGNKEVTVSLKNISFNPKNLLITKGARIVWTNNDDVEHTVNTDAHPAHTYYLSQNSRTLKKGDTYSVTFDKAGIYPYHCTPHAGSMTGSIVVE